MPHDESHSNQWQPSSSAVKELIVMRKRETLYMATNELVVDDPPNSNVADEIIRLKKKSFWRRKICLWFFRVADHYTLSRETVAISLSYYDRFMSHLTHSSPESISSELVSLLSLSALYLATKVQTRNHISIKTFAALSTGSFSIQEIVRMESQIISVLDWKLNPPTQESFVRLFLEMIQISEQVKLDLFERAQYNTEISLCDDSIMKYPASTVALASILLAMENYSRILLPPTLCDQFFCDVKNKVGIKHTSKGVQSVRNIILLIQQQNSNQFYDRCSKNEYDISFNEYERSPNNITICQETMGGCSPSAINH